MPAAWLGKIKRDDGLAPVRHHGTNASRTGRDNRQYLELVSALLPEGVEATSRNFAEAMLGHLPILPVAKLAGALRPDYTYTYKRFWVACLVERSYRTAARAYWR